MRPEKPVKTEREDLQPELRREAQTTFPHLEPSNREAILIKSWMAHDARWFVAVLREFGMEVTNRLNQEAAREVGKFEARRVIKAARSPRPQTVRDFLLFQEMLIGFLGPELLDYGIRMVGADADAFELHVRRCFAADNIIRGGLADSYECGILPRMLGWLETLGIGYTLEPPLGKCMQCAGRECVYTLTLKFHQG